MSLVAAEFFAGIGLVRMGLEAAGVRVAWANDWSELKRDMYVGNFGDDGSYVLRDVTNVHGCEVPDVDVAWASFPCTDLSLAGDRGGLTASESGTFFEWIRILREMADRRPSVVAAENVVGLATSRGGDDLRVAVRCLNELGYSVDVLSLDARRFVPQSRQRLLLVGSTDPVICGVDKGLRPEWLDFVFSDPALRTHQAALPAPPALLTAGFSKVADRLAPGDPGWWDADRTERFLGSLSAVQSERLEELRSGRKICYRTAYRRTRNKVPVWEIRADDIAGCLRTARGGSSKQAVVRAGNGAVRVRWMTPHEYTVLMGAPNFNIEGCRASQVMFGCGDAVAVPVVDWLAEHYLVPLAAGQMSSQRRYA